MSKRILAILVALLIMGGGTSGGAVTDLDAGNYLPVESQFACETLYTTDADVAVYDGLCTITFIARTEAPTVFWFVDGESLGVGKSFVLTPISLDPGRITSQTVRAVALTAIGPTFGDTKGLDSAPYKIEVHPVPTIKAVASVGFCEWADRNFIGVCSRFMDNAIEWALAAVFAGVAAFIAF